MDAPCLRYLGSLDVVWSWVVLSYSWVESPVRVSGYVSHSLPCVPTVVEVVTEQAQNVIWQDNTKERKHKCTKDTYNPNKSAIRENRIRREKREQQWWQEKK